MIVIVGKSGSGKSTVENILKQKGYKKIVSYTTRQPRTGEVNGIDYTYITQLQFDNMVENNLFAEMTYYNGNYYGILKKDCVNDSVAVVELNGLKQLQSIEDIDVYAVGVLADADDRFFRMLKRGDSFANALKRIENDAIAFQELDLLFKYSDKINVNGVIYNDGDLHKLNYLVDQLIKDYKKFQDKTYAIKEF